MPDCFFVKGFILCLTFGGGFYILLNFGTDGDCQFVKKWVKVCLSVCFKNLSYIKRELLKEKAVPLSCESGNERIFFFLGAPPFLLR